MYVQKNEEKIHTTTINNKQIQYLHWTVAGSEIQFPFNLLFLIY